MGKNLRRERRKRTQRTTILLVTNGGKTEKTYLGMLKDRVPRGSGLSIKTSWHDGKEPKTILKNLLRPRTRLAEYDEVWIVVDHDGTDRTQFLAECQKITRPKVIGVVSVPCFEVWLNAHYGPVRNYQSQEDAQRHYLELTGLPAKERKSLPTDFPFDSFTRACPSSRLPGIALPETNTQGPCPSTTMPHLLKRLGLIAGHLSR